LIVQNASSSSAAAAGDESVEVEAIKKFDPLAVDESQRMLEPPPLRPLPAPMQPEILPSAKVASTIAAMGACCIL